MMIFLYLFVSIVIPIVAEPKTESAFLSEAEKTGSFGVSVKHALGPHCVHHVFPITAKIRQLLKHSVSLII